MALAGEPCCRVYGAAHLSASVCVGGCVYVSIDRGVTSSLLPSSPGPFQHRFAPLSLSV